MEYRDDLASLFATSWPTSDPSLAVKIPPSIEARMHRPSNRVSVRRHGPGRTMTSKTATLGTTAALCFAVVLASILAATLWDYPESMWVLLVPIGMFVAGALGVAALAGMLAGLVTDR